MTDADATNEPIKISPEAVAIRRVLSRFVRDIDSLQFAYRTVGEAIFKASVARKDAATSFLAELGIDPKNFAGSSIPFERLGEWIRLIQASSIADSSAPATRAGLFLVLVSKWDAYVGNLLRWLFSVQPSIIDNSERSLSLSDLVKMGNIENARSHIVALEIEAILRTSHVDQFRYFEDRLKIPLRKDLLAWPKFVELTQRRNLLAHTDGVVSEQYIKICTEHKCDVAPETAVGTKLDIKRAYFRNSCHTILEVGVMLGYVLWNKLRPNDIEIS